MFSFFKRKKPSDDKAQESSSSSDAHLPAAIPDDPSAADTALPETIDAADESALPETMGTVAESSVPETVESAAELSAALDYAKESSPSGDPAAEPSTITDDAAQDTAAAAQDSDAATQEPAVAAQESAAATQESDDAAATPPADVPEEKPAQPKGSWLARLKKGLSRTGQSIGGLFVDVKLDDDLYDELETALIMADAGVEATTQLLGSLRARVRKERLTDAMQARAALRDILTEHLKPLEKDFPLGSVKPLIMMIAGVNGAGKTTSIGKLANTFQAEGAKVLLAAGDTFRAAAREQLLEWGSRNNVTVIAQEGGDPAAVAFDAVNAGRARQADVVMIDTAGRLPTQLHLMEELKKIKRVVNKADGNAPHEVLLVVDGNSGQNVIAQIRAFDAAIGLTGLVVTKLDGTAKGGILAAVAAGSQGVRPVPVYWIGVGESIHDLQPFRAHEFSAALVGDAGHAQK